MAGVLILCSDSSIAEAVYTDVEPDIEIQFDGQTAGIDMDNNGTFDFAFLKTSDTYDWGSAQRLRRRIWAGPEFISNEIAGDYFYYSAGGGVTYFPYALESSSVINNDLSFQYWGFQIMAIAIANSNTPSDWVSHGGHWTFIEGFHFMGVRFYSDDECRHYGWIRCTVMDTANILVIHDYAFETKCETSILAGDLIGDTTVAVEEVLDLDAIIYCFNSTLYINMPLQINNANVEVYDLSGVMIYSDKITNQFTQLKLNDAKGLYVVELFAGENKLTKKIYIN
jgi:hypothetical protein